MKKTIIYLLILFSFFINSCKEETERIMRILIRNHTDYPVQLRLFPTTDYRHLDMYKFSSGSGYRSTEFELEPGTQQELFISKDLSKSAHELVTIVFYGIDIILQNEAQTSLKFDYQRATNYQYNIFAEELEWIMETNQYEMPVGWRNNPVESHDYFFEIHPEQIIED